MAIDHCRTHDKKHDTPCYLQWPAETAQKVLGAAACDR